MALFVVRHQHPADRCPARDPYLGATLLNHLSRPNVRQHGLQIQAEAVLQGEHVVYFIARANDEANLRDFMRPFEGAGNVDIYPAKTCASVVASGGCTVPMPASGLMAALDPEEACQQAIEAGLVVHRAHPLNCETSIPALVGGVIVPNTHFYVRNHFHIPRLHSDSYRLTVTGSVERPLALSLDDLHNMKSRTLVATLECAGNGRSLFEPCIEGEKWGLGAVSTAEWTGVPLVEVLDRANVWTDAREVVFRGADRGGVNGHSGPVRFERSLKLDDSRFADLLLAYAMNGEPLPIQHGYPVRLIAPGWYAMASVKWLTEIELINGPFVGNYQTEKYWYEWQRDDRVVREPVTLQRVRALISEPGPDEVVRRGELAIRGVAWSGEAPVKQVEVSIGDGGWQKARFVGDRKDYGWQRWEIITGVERRGNVTLSVRATDLAGRTQPERSEWNRLGYGNNSIQQLRIQVT